MPKIKQYITALQQHHWPAPAKLNLFLHVVGRYQHGPLAGYHQLQTLFQILNYSDVLNFKLLAAPAIQLHCPALTLPINENLVFRAAQTLYTQAIQDGLSPAGVQITLDKKLPLGGGVGGGSSDAATTLVILNELWQLHYSQETLLQLALSLGADVPIFIFGHSAFAEGVGEQLHAIDLPPHWYVIINPKIEISTVKIFNASSLTRNTTKVRIPPYEFGFGQNDCQTIVCQHYPVIQTALNWLAQFTESRLTGTGACVFGAFTDENEAKQVAAQIPTDWQGFVAKGVNCSPLHQQLKDLQTHLGV